MRTFTRSQATLRELDHALRTLFAPKAAQARATPVPGESAALSSSERKHAAGLMRINHAGEVAAQALYFGHATFADSPDTKALMLAAAAEEGDHLAWCAERLEQLDAKGSIAGPIFYAGAFAIGALSARAGDKVALGFVAETERQVEAHLLDHETRLPAADHASRSIVQAMRADEIAHGQAAMAAGGAKLSWPVPALMVKAADVMRWLAYRV
jgi:3-demethoxyubiquinol 3-hydroxylase